MNIKVSIDTDDIFDEDGSCSNESCERGQLSLTAMIKDADIYETKNAILKQISDQSKVEMQTQAAAATLDAMKFHISQTIASTVSNLRLKSYFSSEQISVSDYIKERVEKDLTGRNFPDIIEKVTREYTATIKERYDRLFAAQLLDKLMKAGLIKDEAISKILTIEEPK